VPTPVLCTSRRAGNPRPFATSLAARGVAVLAALALSTGVAVEAASPAAAVTANPSATAVRYALAQLGKSYSYGATGPSSFDCSGLSMKSYAYAGVSIPRISRDQYRLLPKLSRKNARPGDLMFWGSSASTPSSVYHVGIYLGNNKILHAPHTGTVVQIATVWSSDLMPYVARPSAAAKAAILPVEVGSAGDDVRDVQMRLRANGFAVKVDGVYGTSTYQAVHALQRSIGLTGSGLVGPSTWGYLVTHGVMTRTT